MRPLLIMTRLALFATAALAAPSGRDPLDSLRWTARPVLIFSDRQDDPQAARQIAAFDSVRHEVRERDIRVIRKVGPASAALRHRLGVPTHGFAVVLVGKDGSVKNVWQAPIAPREIFSLIDEMPMRRREMRS